MCSACTFQNAVDAYLACEMCCLPRKHAAAVGREPTDEQPAKKRFRKEAPDAAVAAPPDAAAAAPPDPVMHHRDAFQHMMKAAATHAKWSASGGGGGGGAALPSDAPEGSAALAPSAPYRPSTCKETGLTMDVTQHPSLPGQFLVHNFISEAEEAALLEWVDSVPGGGAGAGWRNGKLNGPVTRIRRARRAHAHPSKGACECVVQCSAVQRSAVHMPRDIGVVHSLKRQPRGGQHAYAFLLTCALLGDDVIAFAGRTFPSCGA